MVIYLALAILIVSVVRSAFTQEYKQAQYICLVAIAVALIIGNASLVLMK